MRVVTFKVTEDGYEALRAVRHELYAAKAGSVGELIRCALHEYLRQLNHEASLDVLAPGDDCDSITEALKRRPVIKHVTVG